jgi:L-fuconolactonase
MESIVRHVRTNPRQLALRMGLRPEQGEDRAFQEGVYDKLLATAQAHGVPVMIALPRVTPLVKRNEVLRQKIEQFGETQFILENCHVLPMAQDDVARGRRVPESLEIPLKLSDLSNVAIKWSWAPLLSREAFPFPDITSCLRRYVDAFGAHRIMWGSDHSQTKWHSTWAESLYYIVLASELSDDEKASILGGAARTMLRWPAGQEPDASPAQ